MRLPVRTTIVDSQGFSGLQKPVYCVETAALKIAQMGFPFPSALNAALEHASLRWERLTDFLRLLARHVSRRGLVDHKGAVTQSSGHSKLAVGGPNQPIGVVAKLARCTTSRFALRLAE